MVKSFILLDLFSCGYQLEGTFGGNKLKIDCLWFPTGITFMAGGAPNKQVHQFSDVIKGGYET